ncbi:MAG: DegV family protein [Firmicutes bacterium]|nr:DegV family protein [Bacillota bacterium]
MTEPEAGGLAERGPQEVRGEGFRDGRRVALVTDSTATLPPGWAAAHGVAVVPLTVRLGSREYLDGVELSPGDFFRRLRETGEWASTSQPAPERFLAAYRQAAEAGAGEILVLTLSSRLSGTYASAVAAAELWREEGGPPVHVWDSRSAAGGHALLVTAARRLADNGADAAAILAALERLQPALHLEAVVETLRYLAHGGRIGRAAAWAGTLLDVKPVIALAPDGVVEPVARVRTFAAALRWLLDSLARRYPDRTRPLHLVVIHADNPEAAERLEQGVRQLGYPLAEFWRADFTPVLGAHTGPGLAGFCDWQE